jgi:methanogenic corrinoid protein MtbC1
MWTQTNGHSPVAVACCAPGERHVVGLMMVCDVLRARGLTVHMLGEGAPAESIRDFSLESRARLLCISCALTVHLPEAMEVIQHVRSACPDIVVLAGGAAFRGSPDRARRLGADHYAPNVRALQQAMPAIIAGLNGAAPA